MGLHRRLAEKQLRGDLEFEPRRDELQHVALAFRERGERRRALSGSGSVANRSSSRFVTAGAKRVTVGDDPDRIDKLRAGGRP